MVEVGQRVRVRISGECPIHAHPYALLAADGEVGTVVDDMRAPRWDWPPFGEGWPGRLNAAEHWWAVRFDHVMRWHDGTAADADRYCAVELIPIDEEVIDAVG
jgi:hypothetical protein